MDFMESNPPRIYIILKFHLFSSNRNKNNLINKGKAPDVFELNKFL